METSIVEKILLNKGPLPSSKIKDVLVKMGLSDSAARKRISRTKGKVRRLISINLPKRENFLYLDKQYGSYEFWSSLIAAHTEANSSYGIAINSIIARGGKIPFNHFNIVSGSPQKLSKHLSSSVVLSKLISCKLLRKVDDSELGKIIEIDTKGWIDKITSWDKKTSLLVEDIIINGVRDWLRKIGLAGYHSIKIRSGKAIPDFGRFNWDITSPSYIYPLVEMQKKLIPGFIVADVVYGKMNQSQVQYFINKCKTNRKLNKMRPFLPLLVADRFTKAAFNKGKKEGIIFTTPGILFGDEIAKSINDLSSTLKNAAAVAAKNPEKINKIFSSLSKIEGAAINLRGALFELIVGHLVLQGEGNSIDIGVKVTDNKGRTAEIDVRRVKGNHEIVLYECKGRQPSTEITESEIKKWLDNRIPVIKKALMLESRFQNMNFTFEYWTTGIFAKKAQTLLKNYKSKKFSIDWKNGKEVLSYAKKINATSMVTILKEHYMNHPLS